ncbi:MAG: signal peptidase I [Gammaproteobacteria bacterium]|nr:signal peptidase I [Gammaproteobacteria bacterium]
MSFPALMVTLVFVTGIIWLIDSFFWAPKRLGEQKDPLVVEYAKSFFPIILVVLVIRSFIAEPFRIPSASMLPTLHIGDFILVNKFSYGVRLPVLNTKVIAIGEPERGDVVVFRYPKNPQVDYIKRVIGLPGDTVGYFNKTVYINGNKVAQDVKEKDINLISLVPARNELRFEQLTELGHDILVDPDRRLIEGEAVVPAGEYFVMGDNRDNSNDSRFWGTVPEENLVGKAFFIWMSWDWNSGGIVWNRLGNSIN